MIKLFACYDTPKNFPRSHPIPHTLSRYLCKYCIFNSPKIRTFLPIPHRWFHMSVLSLAGTGAVHCQKPPCQSPYPVSWPPSSYRAVAYAWCTVHRGLLRGEIHAPCNCRSSTLGASVSISAGLKRSGGRLTQWTGFPLPPE